MCCFDSDVHAYWREQVSVAGLLGYDVLPCNYMVTNIMLAVSVAGLLGYDVLLIDFFFLT